MNRNRFERTAHHEPLEHRWGTQACLKVSTLVEEDAEEFGLEESGCEGEATAEGKKGSVGKGADVNEM